MSWSDATAWLATAGGGLRLPSEAEWEYACRAGTGGAVFAGSWKILGQHDAPALDPIAWYGGNSGVGYDRPDGYDCSGWLEMQHERRLAGTRRVRGKQPNAWGLFDMLGNVGEWCGDSYGPYPEAPRDGSARTVEGKGLFRVYRGGGWSSAARSCRSPNRSRHTPDHRWDYLGFRPAASLP